MLALPYFLSCYSASIWDISESNERIIVSLFLSKPYDGYMSMIRCDHQQSTFFFFTGRKHFGIKANCFGKG